MTIRTLILNFLSLLLLVQCSSKQNDASATALPLDSQVKPLFFSTAAKSFSICGEWTYNFPFYSSELVFDKNGTFKFHEQGCLGHGYTEGKWVQDESSFILTSFAKYKEKTKMSVVKPEPIPITKSKKRKVKKNDTLVLPAFEPGLITTSFSYKSSDTSNIYFDKVNLKLQGDTLYKLDKNGLQTNAKFVMKKNNEPFAAMFSSN